MSIFVYEWKGDKLNEFFIILCGLVEYDNHLVDNQKLVNEYSTRYLFELNLLTSVENVWFYLFIYLPKIQF